MWRATVGQRCRSRRPGSPVRAPRLTTLSRRLLCAGTPALLVGLLLLLEASRAMAQEPPGGAEEPAQLPPVVVIGTTPLPALGIPSRNTPATSSPSPAEDIENQNLLTMPDTLYRNFGSVNLNNTQGNPWQTDLTYRGLPGLAADRQPHRPLDVSGRHALQQRVRGHHQLGSHSRTRPSPDIDIIPGSNPIYGLNTLGGALAVHTKRGFDFPGAELEAYGGSFGRWAVDGGVRRVPRPVRLVSHLQRPQRRAAGATSRPAICASCSPRSG